jgi:hypothetical protein
VVKVKASKLVEEIQKLIEKHGDCDVYYCDDEKLTGFDSADIIEQKTYGFGNKTKIFYIE